MSLTHDETMLPGDDCCMKMRGIAVGYTSNIDRPLVFHGINGTGTIELECVTQNNTVPGGAAFAQDPDYKVMGAVDDGNMSTTTIGRFVHCGMMSGVSLTAGANGYWIYRDSTPTSLPHFEWTTTPTDQLGKIAGLTLDDTEGRIFILPWRI